MVDVEKILLLLSNNYGKDKPKGKVTIMKGKSLMI